MKVRMHNPYEGSTKSTNCVQQFLGLYTNREIAANISHTVTMLYLQGASKKGGLRHSTCFALLLQLEVRKSSIQRLTC